MATSSLPSNLVRSAYDDLRALVRSGDPAARVLVTTAAILFTSAVVHALVWAVDGGPWLGPVTWRKPILFGVSGGLLSVSLAWVVAQLPAARRRLGLARLYAATMLPEVALITLQKWRGVASHFNVSSPLDQAVYGLMGALILTASVPLVVWTVQAYRSPGLAPALRATLLPALGFALVSILFGLALSGHGDVVLKSGTGADPAIVGAAGALKVPHGVAIHGLQVLPVLGWLLLRGGLPEGERVRWLQRATLGYALLVASAALLALSGRAVLDPSAAALALAFTGALLVGAAYARAFAAALGPVPALPAPLSE